MYTHYNTYFIITVCTHESSCCRFHMCSHAPVQLHIYGSGPVPRDLIKHTALIASIAHVVIYVRRVIRIELSTAEAKVTPAPPLRNLACHMIALLIFPPHTSSAWNQW